MSERAQPWAKNQLDLDLAGSSGAAFAPPPPRKGLAMRPNEKEDEGAMEELLIVARACRSATWRSNCACWARNAFCASANCSSSASIRSLRAMSLRSASCVSFLSDAFWSTSLRRQSSGRERRRTAAGRG